MNFINLTTENLEQEHLCCIIRSRKPHPGVEAKRQWLSDRLKEGHVFRKLNAKGCCFIEYAPLEMAWVPINGDNFYYIYCLITMVHGELWRSCTRKESCVLSESQTFILTEWWILLPLHGFVLW